MPKYTTNIKGNVRGHVQGAALTINQGGVAHRYTTEDCPQVCGAQARCEHALTNTAGQFVHSWNCPACGRYEAIVMYPCANCAD